uniref:hypothetical protein n=1 Tax=Agathobacter sp. TaxID=2021311 RepID=UPI004056A8CB
MRKRYKHAMNKLPQKSHRLETRDDIQILLLVAIFIMWLFIRNIQMDVDGNSSAQSPAMERLLEIAMQPMGSTMYIWGGGWDVDDEKSGAGSTKIGVSSTWAEFAQKQDAAYNYEDYRYQRELGLDCSGYVGWVIYNLFETEDGKEGYVTFSTEMAENFASRGWGRLYKNPKEFLAGDIVSMDGHVWICLGTCADGSVLLIHSSPPGVSICGTGIPIYGMKDSNDDNQDMPNQVPSETEPGIAVQLAEEFMGKHYPEWQTAYPNRMVSQAYLENVMVMRWNVETLADAQVYQAMSGEEVLQVLESHK